MAKIVRPSKTYFRVSNADFEQNFSKQKQKGYIKASSIPQLNVKHGDIVTDSNRSGYWMVTESTQHLRNLRLHRRIKGTLKKTNRVVLGSNGNRGVIKRRLYIDNKGDLYAKYFGNWWKFPEEIEHYGTREE